MWILQARILEWLAVLSLRGSCQPRDLAHISYDSCIDSQAFFFFFITIVPPGLCTDLPISTRLWKEEAHSLIPMWPFRRMIFCYSLRVVTRLGCQYSCLATARFWIIACLHHWGAKLSKLRVLANAQVEESAWRDSCDALLSLVESLGSLPVDIETGCLYSLLLIELLFEGKVCFRKDSGLSSAKKYCKNNTAVPK